MERRGEEEEGGEGGKIEGKIIGAQKEKGESEGTLNGYQNDHQVGRTSKFPN